MLHRRNYDLIVLPAIPHSSDINILLVVFDSEQFNFVANLAWTFHP
jgi:hypothetical protein